MKSANYSARSGVAALNYDPTGQLPRSRPLGSRLALGATFAIGVFVLGFRLTTPTWFIDEAIYAQAGYEYVVEGKFDFNLEHPPFFKQVLGVSQAIVGESLAAVRLPAILFAFGTGIVLFAFGRRLRGWWAGLLAALLWFLLPHTGWPWLEDVARVKIERFAVADVMVSLLSLSALWAGWLWVAYGRMRWALLAGLLAGLAAASKPPGILVIPGIVVGGVLIQRASRDSITQAGGLLALAAIAALAPYAQFGSDGMDGIRMLFDLQLAHSEGGHAVIVAGTTYVHPPWWAHAWWQWKMIGTPASVSILVALSAAMSLGERREVAYVLAAVIVPFLFLSLLLGFQLPHHALIWQAPLALVVAIGIIELASRVDWRRPVAVIVLIPLLLTGFATIREVAGIERSDYAKASDLLRAREAAAGPIVVLGWGHLLLRYFPDAPIASPEQLPKARAIVLDDVFDWVFLNDEIRRWLKDHRSEFHRVPLKGVSLLIRR